MDNTYIVTFSNPRISELRIQQMLESSGARHVKVSRMAAVVTAQFQIADDLADADVHFAVHTMFDDCGLTSIRQGTLR